MKSVTLWTRAEKRGYLDFGRGKPLSANPYTARKQRVEWEAMWYEAQMQKKDRFGPVLAGR